MWKKLSLQVNTDLPNLLPFTSKSKKKKENEQRKNLPNLIITLSLSCRDPDLHLHHHPSGLAQDFKQSLVHSEPSCQGPHQHKAVTANPFHWLLVKFCTSYKTLLLSNKSLNALAVDYCTDLPQQATYRRPDVKIHLTSTIPISGHCVPSCASD